MSIYWGPLLNYGNYNIRFGGLRGFQYLEKLASPHVDAIVWVGVARFLGRFILRHRHHVATGLGK